MVPGRLNLSSVLGCSEKSYSSMQFAFNDAHTAYLEINSLRREVRNVDTAKALLMNLYKVRDIIRSVLNTRVTINELELRSKTLDRLDDLNELSNIITFRISTLDKVLRSSIRDARNEINRLLYTFELQPIVAKTPACKSPKEEKRSKEEKLPKEEKQSKPSSSSWNICIIS
jgi:hypothetical protein